MSGVAPDGSPVAFYRRLPAMGEPELIHAAIPPAHPCWTWAADPGGSRVPWPTSGTR